MNRIAQLLLAFTVSMLPVVVQAAPSVSPRDIMDKMADARRLDGSEAVIKMTIINEKGEKRERTIAVATKLVDAGKTEKRIYKFLAPSDVKGTGVLVFDYDAKDDDMSIYMPALRKTRRIIASQKSKSFMGSEFSYGDFNLPNLDQYAYKMLPEEKASDALCHVIEVTPKDASVAKDEGYSKKVLWIGKDDFSVRKAVYYDLQGKELKNLLVKDVRLMDPAKKRYRAMHMEMTNVQSKCRSVFDSSKMAFSKDVKDEYFTPAYLERP